MKLVEHSSNIVWKSHKLSWNLLELSLHLCEVISRKGVRRSCQTNVKREAYNDIYDTSQMTKDIGDVLLNTNFGILKGLSYKDPSPKSPSMTWKPTWQCFLEVRLGPRIESWVWQKARPNLNTSLMNIFA